MPDLIFALVLLIVAFLSFQKKKLTLTAAVIACVVAIFIYLGTEFSGIYLLGAFFILGVLSTSWQRKTKEHFGFAEDDDGRRNARQVLANGAVAATLGLIAYIFPEHETILVLMIACSFSSAAADTVASELGIVYGKKFYNVLDFKPGNRGENGVVSVEGTLLGIAASIIIALIFSLTNEWLASSFFAIIIAGLIGNIADSILGATLENNNIIGNNAVNFINTLIAALAGGLIAYV